MSRASLVAVAVLAALSGPLSGCAGAAAGGAAVVTTAAVEERGLKGSAKDALIRARIDDLWLAKSEEMFRKVGLTISEGRVLLTGKVRTQQMRLDAVRLAWQAKGVKEVINEIEVTDKGGLAEYARDSWITAQLVTRLLFDKQVQSINYSIETVGGVVYVMGIAQDQAELDRVTNHARNLKYVRKVVPYVRLKTDPRRLRS